MRGHALAPLVTKNKAVRKAREVAMARLSPPTLAQVASEAALQTSADYFKEVREQYVERRDSLVEVCSIPG